MRVRLIAVAALAGCGYRGGTFTGPAGGFVGDQVSVGCVDIAIAPAHDPAAEGPVIAYEFGNRCDRPARVDFTAVAVRGRTAGGEAVVLEPYDPGGELRAERLEARRTGREVIEYHAASGEALTMVCADVGAIADGDGGPREICMDGGGL